MSSLTSSDLLAELGSLALATLRWNLASKVSQSLHLIGPVHMLVSEQAQVAQLHREFVGFDVSWVPVDDVVAFVVRLGFQ